MNGPVLILGGTGEARELAARLVADGIPVVSSLAGRVANPRLPAGPVRIGGFGGVAGLARWLAEQEPRVVIDATHPFAARISRHAVEATSQTGVPLVRLLRPAWEPEPTDRWTRVPDIAAAAEAVQDSSASRVLLTTGRQDVGAFAGITGPWFLIRVVDPPTADLPPGHEVLRSRGPYRLEDERELLRANRIDLLVTKNSGGGLTRAKLVAARELGIPVVMVDRPPETAARIVNSVEDAARIVGE
ncbi:cobalt-precorrin-6A reductase [Gordonia crocea]|uniref:Precorrin-6A reductase n=1 Tax=Gordonia crocea TaxID=589162 RepID=A0A7I9UXU7_9ACTN|nr:cobalt-precorrin-6A reductase [Gordonia crocea]GED97988.1 precorrin-6A reductase [Gordonia crocea]